MNKLLDSMKRFCTSEVIARRREALLIHKTRIVVLGTAVALTGGALLFAPAGDSDAAPDNLWKYKNVKATICGTGKPAWGGPSSRPGCDLIATTVSGQVAYNGKAVWGKWRNCDHQSTLATNRVTWCGFWNNGGAGPQRFMSLGANGEGEIGAKGVSVRKNSYWIRIDVRPDGTANLRGGSNSN
jgi:hypothetical protein